MKDAKVDISKRDAMMEMAKTSAALQAFVISARVTKKRWAFNAIGQSKRINSTTKHAKGGTTAKK